MPDKKIALTGGIATGKTTVANKFRDLGAIILDADEYARQAVKPGTASFAALRELIGPAYLNPDGTLRRRELRQRIIQEPTLRQRVDAVLHPYIMQAMRADWEKLKELDPHAVIIFDIPLLFEGGFEKDFDIVILVYSSPEAQVQRLIRRDEVLRSEAEHTLDMQLPIDSKKASSHYIIENCGDLEKTMRQVEQLWATIASRA